MTKDFLAILLLLWVSGVLFSRSRLWKDPDNIDSWLSALGWEAEPAAPSSSPAWYSSERWRNKQSAMTDSLCSLFQADWELSGHVIAWFSVLAQRDHTDSSA